MLKPFEHGQRGLNGPPRRTVQHPIDYQRTPIGDQILRQDVVNRSVFCGILEGQKLIAVNERKVVAFAVLAVLPDPGGLQPALDVSAVSAVVAAKIVYAL